MNPAGQRGRSARRRRAAMVLVTLLVLTACGQTKVSGPADPEGAGVEVVELPLEEGASVQPRPEEGEPAEYQVDPTVTLHDVVFSPYAGEERIWFVSLRIRNDDGVSREFVLPNNSDPRYERIDGGLRLTWLRTAVASSDPETGAVTFDLSWSSTETVAVFRREELEIDGRHIEQLDFDPEDEFELCLEAMEPFYPNSPMARTPTGVESVMPAGYEDGETVPLACGPATIGPDVEFLEPDY